jgi:hypothetical protein
MNLNGNIEGPVLKNTYSCEECKYFSDEYIWLNYKCLHPNLVKSFSGLEINKNKETPMFCPFLLKKLRLDKLNKLNKLNN